MSEKTTKDQKKSGPRPSLDTPLIKPQKHSVTSGLRSSFFAGVVVAAPIGITAAIVYWFVTGPMQRLDLFVRNILPAGDSRLETIVQAIPGLGVALAIIGIILLGAFAKNFFGRVLIRAGENLVESMPVVRTLYRFFKNVFETALQQSTRSFKEVALIEYPRAGAWTMAFVVGDAKGEVKHELRDQGDDLISVFVPTVPNPTSGFLLFVPRKDMKVLSMPIEEAAKLVFSLGLVVPEFDDPSAAVTKLETLAEEAGKDRRSLLSKLSVRRSSEG